MHKYIYHFLTIEDVTLSSWLDFLINSLFYIYIYIHINKDELFVNKL